MRKMIKSIVLCCDVCQRVKHPNQNVTGKFLQVTSTKPNEMIAIDFYGPLVPSTGGVQYILVVLDVCSRLVTLYAMKKATTLATINRIKEYFQKIGKPSRILTDHGTQFTASKWTEFLRDNKIQPVFCSIRHPNSNPSERIMRILGQFFRIYCNEKHTSWAKYLNEINQYLNLVTHTTTGFTPHELHYGYSPKQKITNLIRFPENEVQSHEVIIEIANQRTRQAYEKRRQRQKVGKLPKYKVGDLVLLKIPKQSDAINKKISKFFHLYYGPFEVARVFNENAFELSELHNKDKIIGHYNRLHIKPYRQFHAP